MRRAVAVVEKALATPWVLRTDGIVATPTRYLLFFDGGSRGNPGPGGSGAVIVALGSTVVDCRVCWVASMSYAAKKTTNNVAENMGLLTGLRACQQHKWGPVHVVGDSQVIIRQQKSRIPPKATHLKSLYWQSRRLADQVRILSWQHHLRAFNTAADSLANVAMDSKHSIQQDPNVFPSAKWKETLAKAANDLAHWRENNPDEAPSGAGADPV
ncbi:hypothetical protein PHMEG_0005152 [Phytophthora megakarya]|uniref:RNase H type-1 domain-containing protein n=1 Tax=Phytophthora megakarya TaxID=4795 RepID=A0A225WTJ6_9STRA|nr:hypothetical protein PHMEG_0005152 [Phytophthora megakarya]